MGFFSLSPSPPVQPVWSRWTKVTEEFDRMVKAKVHDVCMLSHWSPPRLLPWDMGSRPFVTLPPSLLRRYTTSSPLLSAQVLGREREERCRLWGMTCFRHLTSPLEGNYGGGISPAFRKKNCVKRSREQKQMNSVGSPVQNREQDSRCGDHDATVASAPNNSGTV